ncbi:MAG: DUF169 domain-containing protein [Desulfobacterota bacterium]|nr:DUF169 domain-containing protein [Thermodesulfobacteriota bacterium]
MTNVKEISQLLMSKAKIRGNPVAISLFRDVIPSDYEPIQDTPCTIIRYAMDDGKKVFFDAEHHDCYVGVHHAGIVPGKREIVAGLYLSQTSSFFTEEGAARLKAGTYALPPGMVKAIGAAPLHEIPDGVPINWIVIVCNPHTACILGGCRMCQDGVPCYGTFGTSLCGELFAVPWYIKNVMVVGGDFGGRMHNKIKQDQLFVIIPNEYLAYIPNVLLNIKVDVKTSRQMTKPPHSPFWKKQDVPQPSELQQESEEISPQVTFTMAWEDDARKMLNKVPAELLEMIIPNAEHYARENGYAAVSMRSIREQMEKMGMNLDEMLASM